jgi:hypothetical protein
MVPLKPLNLKVTFPLLAREGLVCSHCGAFAERLAQLETETPEPAVICQRCLQGAWDALLSDGLEPAKKARRAKR